MTQELKEFDAAARTWLSAAAFPRDLGNSLVTAVSRVTQVMQHMTPDQLESYGLEEFKKLERLFGDTLEE